MSKNARRRRPASRSGTGPSKAPSRGARNGPGDGRTGGSGRPGDRPFVRGGDRPPEPAGAAGPGTSGRRSTPAAPGRPTVPAVPPGVRVVVGAALLEALALVVLAVWGMAQLVAGQQSSPGVVIFLVVFALVTSAALVLSARALWAGRRTGRAPVATWQLLQGAVALVVLQATAAPAAWVVLVLSAGVFFLLLTRPVVAHTVDR